MQGLAFLVPLVGIVAACITLGVNRASYYRARMPKPDPKPRPRPARALSDEERARVRATLDSDAFMDKAPAQVYAKLLEDGEYLCSPRTMYRVLAAHDEVRERRAQRHHPEYKKPQLVGTAPNQVWSWDTTKLPGPTKPSLPTCLRQQPRS
jgi:transposase InsO family protein